MSRDDIANALDKAADALAEAAHALRASDTPSSEAAAAAGASAPQAPAARPIQEQHVAAALGVCPAHRTAWTVKQGGTSKNGKPYRAFWKCSGKNDDGSYCNLKPVKAWADTHPIPEEVPF